MRRTIGRPQSKESNDAPPTSLVERTVVLVVDDDAGVRDALHVVLDEEYAVIEAAHGRTALDLVLSPDIESERQPSSRPREDAQEGARPPRESAAVGQAMKSVATNPAEE